ncbi:MAG: UDP-glucose 4-epimerase GalE [Acidimicrobiia bacterium]
MHILVTGGTGYIGSHTVVELLTAGHDVEIVDNLANSSRVAVDRIERITGSRAAFHEVDIRDERALDAIVARAGFDAVVHFAGLKSVEESVAQPLAYFDNNVGGTVSLCRVLDRHDVRTILFSSSATVYGDTTALPMTEDAPTGTPANPYGRTKLFIEEILRDLHTADERWSVTLLRYFNPVGAHESGLIGEDPLGLPNNLMPYVAQVAVGRLDRVTIFGDDYDTPDGTGVRDYIHVVDLARGHVAALQRLAGRTGVQVYNLGTGTGTSVRELVAAFEDAAGVSIPTVVGPRRAGDIAASWCDASRAQRDLDWAADRGIVQMCEDAWRWQSSNPAGYAT